MLVLVVVVHVALEMEAAAVRTPLALIIGVPDVVVVFDGPAWFLARRSCVLLFWTRRRGLRTLCHLASRRGFHAV